MKNGILIKNIKSLVQVEENPRIKVQGSEMSQIQTIENAYLYIEGELISDFGPMSELAQKKQDPPVKTVEIDAGGKMVFPSFCDSHTHLVYAGSREAEFADKIRGLSYEEIASRGGGILNSAKKLHQTSDNELYTNG